MTIEEAIAKLLQRREIIMITGNAQIQEINNTLALLGYTEPQSVAEMAHAEKNNVPKGE